MKLLFEGNPIAELTNVFEHQGTWFADYWLCSPLPTSLEHFIEFSRDSLSEANFDESMLLRFARYTNSTEWTIVENGGSVALDGAPLFRQSDLSWVV